MAKILNYISDLDESVLIDENNKAFELVVDGMTLTFYNYFQTFGDVELGGYICEFPQSFREKNAPYRVDFYKKIGTEIDNQFDEEYSKTWSGNYFYVLPVEAKPYGHLFPKCCRTCKNKYAFGTSWDVRCNYTREPTDTNSLKLCMLFK